MNGNEVPWAILCDKGEGALSLQWSSQLTVGAKAAAFY